MPGKFTVKLTPSFLKDLKDLPRKEQERILAALKRLESIIATRNEGERFRSFVDFCRRIDLHKFNKRVL